MEKISNVATTSSASTDASDNSYYPNCDFSIWMRTCQPEVTTPVEGTVTGTIPQWLRGSLVRNGPGGVDPYKSEDEELRCKHLFDGPGLLHKFSIENSKVTYMNRYIQTKSYKRNLDAKRLVLGEFGTIATPDPCHTIFKKVSALFENRLEDLITDTANISLHPFGDEVYSLAETPFAHRIDLNNLDTLATVNVNSSMGIINHTSHPHIDATNGKVYNIGQKFDLWNGPHYIIAEMDTSAAPQEEQSETRGESPWSRAKILTSIPCRWLVNTCYMHSFSITPNYFVMIEQPLAIFFPEMPLNLTLRPKPIASMLKFYPEEDTIFHVALRNPPHSQTKVYKFHAPSFFFLHTINAFEDISEDGKCSIVVDICTYKDPNMIDCMFVETLRNAQSNPDYATLFRGRPMRFHLPLPNHPDDFATGEPLRTVGSLIVDFGCETPRINYENYNGKPYKYFYAISSDVDTLHPGMLVKVNIVNQTYKLWGEPQLQSYPSEPIFVSSPCAKVEDDGIVLSSVLYGGESHNGPNNTSLVILDAKSWTILAKIDFSLNSCVPKCLHGWFFPRKYNLSGTEESTSSSHSVLP